MDDRNSLSVRDKLFSAHRGDLVTVTYYNDIKILTSLTGVVKHIDHFSIYLECAMRYEDWIDKGYKEFPMEIRIVPLQNSDAVMDFKFLDYYHVRKGSDQAIREHTKLYSDAIPAMA